MFIKELNEAISVYNPEDTNENSDTLDEGLEMEVNNGNECSRKIKKGVTPISVKPSFQRIDASLE